MKKLMICIQFYDGDRVEAMNLAKFIAGIEPKSRADTELLFVNRSDCEPITAAEIALLIPTFKVASYTAPSSENGHPRACNNMARDLFMESLRRRRSGQWS